MKVQSRLYATQNPRMAQMLRHAGVRVVATASDRVVLMHADGYTGPMDPLCRLLAHLEPTSVDGHEHMPSVDEARALGLIED
jgi:hypothetical protein